MRFSTVVLSFACVSAAFGQPNSSFYVATTGSDSNPGTQSAPWRTVQRAADTARAGSIVNVRGGIYEELVNINASGNASDGFITLRSYPGETAVLDATRFTPTGRQAVLTIHNQSYVRIEGFEIRNFRTAIHRLSPLGISVMGSGSHIELLKNNVHHIEQTFDGRDAPGHGDNGFGIAVYGTDAKMPITDLIIDGNEVHHLKTGSSESLVVNGNVTNFRITHNVVHDNNNIGIDVIGFERTAPDPAVDQARDGVVSGNLVYNIHSRGNPAYQNEENSDGIYVDGGTRILIEQNVIHDDDFGIELASEHKDRATSYITARNNLIYHCHTAGVSIGGYAPSADIPTTARWSTTLSTTTIRLEPVPVSSRCNGTWQAIFLRTTSSTRDHAVSSRRTNHSSTKASRPSRSITTFITVPPERRRALGPGLPPP